MEGLEKLLAAVTARSTAVSRFPRSIMTPLILVSSIAVPTFVTGAVLLQSVPAVCVSLAFSAIACVLACVSMFIYFSLYHPERLQSEDFLSTKTALQIMSKKGEIIVVEQMIDAIQNPDATKQIESQEK